MELIHTYSRAQAIADGVLIDVTDAAKREGFLCPVAVTDTVCAIVEEVYDEAASRLCTILAVLGLEICLVDGDTNILRFSVLMTRTENGKTETEWVALKAICGPGDDAELVMTIMLPEED